MIILSHNDVPFFIAAFDPGPCNDACIVSSEECPVSFIDDVVPVSTFTFAIGNEEEEDDRFGIG